MLNKEPLTLDHPEAVAAKARWDTAGLHASRKHALTFEDFFEYFKADCVRHTSVAVEARLSSQRIGQIYRDFFQELFKKTGYERRVSCTVENTLVRRKKAEQELFDDAFVKKIVMGAQAAGYKVESVLGVGDRLVCRNRLRINGYLCSLHHIRAPSKMYPRSTRWYARSNVAQLTFTEVHALVIRTNIKDYTQATFVLPVSDYLQAYPLSKAGRYSTFYIPLEKKPTYRNHKSRLDYEAYKDAWHLLITQEP